MQFSANLLVNEISGGGGRRVSKRESKRESSGYFALPLPPLPSDVRGNIEGMKLSSDIDPDLVALANQVLRPVVNYEAQANPLPPSLDPFDLTSNYKPDPGGQQPLSPDIPFSIQDILEALDEVNQFPPTDEGYERPYSPSPPLSYPPATHKPPPVFPPLLYNPPPPQTVVIQTPLVTDVKTGEKQTEAPPPVFYRPETEVPHVLTVTQKTVTTKQTTRKPVTETKHTTKSVNKYPHNIKDKLPHLAKPPTKINLYENPPKVTEAPKKPDNYYAVIPYKDITKLFELLNKHVHEPVNYKEKHKKEKKKENKNPFKTRITHFRIPDVKKKKKITKKKKGRKKVVEICSKNGTNFFALFTLGTLVLNVMINFMFNLMVDIMIR